MDLAAIIISVIALIASIIVAVVQYKSNIRINHINLEAIYFNDIYKDYLIKKLPKSRSLLHIDSGGKLLYINDLVIDLQQMRKDSLYYLYKDKAYYTELKKSLQKLEDFLVEQSANTIPHEEYANFHYKIEEDLREIYSLITNKFLGVNAP